MQATGPLLGEKIYKIVFSESNSAEEWDLRNPTTNMTIDRAIINSNVCPGRMRTASFLGGNVLLFVVAYVVSSTPFESDSQL